MSGRSVRSYWIKQGSCSGDDDHHVINTVRFVGDIVTTEGRTVA